MEGEQLELDLWVEERLSQYDLMTSRGRYYQSLMGRAAIYGQSDCYVMYDSASTDMIVRWRV